MKKILITGGCGYLCARLTKYLAKKIPPKPSKIPSHLTLEMLKETLDSPVEPNIILLEELDLEKNFWG